MDVPLAWITCFSMEQENYQQSGPSGLTTRHAYMAAIMTFKLSLSSYSSFSISFLTPSSWVPISLEVARDKPPPLQPHLQYSTMSTMNHHERSCR